MAETSGSGLCVPVLAAQRGRALLNATAGKAVHLTREAGSGDAGKAAVPDHCIEDFARSYDRASVMAPGGLR